MSDKPKNPNISYFAKSNFRENQMPFGIYQDDRFFHTYILGKTGTGKSNLVASLIFEDIKANRGTCLFDIHGDLSQMLRPKIPQHRKKHLIYIDLSDPKLQLRYNPLRHVHSEHRPLVVSSLLETFKKLWKSAWGVKLEHILRHILLSLLAQKEATLADIPRIIQDSEFRQKCVMSLNDEYLIRFWTHEFKQYSKSDCIPILNKVGAFLSYPSLKRFLVSNPIDISLRDIMDKSKILIINLNKGKIGLDASNLAASILLQSLLSAGFTRTNILENNRIPFHIFLDEFQNYTTPSIVQFLSEIRKFKISLTLANQYLSQIDIPIREAIIGNIGTIIAFRTGVQDAKLLAQIFTPIFQTSDLINLENYDIYLKLMIQGKPSQPFSGSTLKFDP